MPRTTFSMLALVLAASLPTQGTACRRDYEPLWTAIAIADLIAVTEVVADETGGQNEENASIGWTRLRVLETLKGPREKTLLVQDRLAYQLCEPLQCTGDDCLEEPQLSIVFLTRDAETWQPTWALAAPICPGRSEREAVQLLLRDAIEMQANLANARELLEAEFEWIVEATLLPSTRHFGLIDLERFDLMHAPESDDGAPAAAEGNDEQAPALEDRHRTRLATAFVHAPRIDETMPPMLEQIGDFADTAVDEFAWGALEAQLAREALAPWTLELLTAVLVRAGDATAKALLSIDVGFLDAEVLRLLWEDAKTEFGLPDVPPLPAKTGADESEAGDGET